MNFAPYQDESPETARALSPPPQNRPFSPPQSPRPQQQKGVARDELPNPGDFENDAGTSTPQPQQQQQRQQQRGGFGNGADERNLDVYGTSLPMRLDFEACMAYLLLPPAGGAILLLFEHKSDYVRFHAWQSSLLFTFLFIFHLIFSFSRVLSFMLLVVDLGLIGYLTRRAYLDADTLDRCELPFFGRLASGFVDDE